MFVTRALSFLVVTAAFPGLRVALVTENVTLYADLIRETVIHPL